jgi:DNA polymerase-3 subunit epsilon
MLVGNPEPEEVFPLFQEFIANSILVAHNAQFDIRFLQHEFGRLGLGLNNRYRCTLKMSRKHYPQLPNHKLETVYRHLFGKMTGEMQMHRALSDARMVAMIWLEMNKI